MFTTSLLLLSALVNFAVAAPTATCTTRTHVANYDDLPTGTIESFKDLRYEGWEVVRATDTPFVASSKNLIRLTGTSGVIRSAPNRLFNDKFEHSYNLGCANSTGAQTCSVSKLYGVPCNYYGCTPPGPTFDIPFLASKYPHSLEEAGGFEPTNTPNITWGLYNNGKPIDFTLYISNYTYYTTDCPQQPGY